MDTKLKILFHCPNVPFLRKAVSRMRIKRLESRQLPESAIAECEGDLSKKKKCVREYIERNDARYVKVKPAIDQIIQAHYGDLTAEEAASVREDMVFCFLAYGFQPDEYYFFHLKDKPMEERQTYVSDIDRNIYFMRMNDICEGEVFLDKSRTYRFYRKYYKRDAITIDHHCGFDDFKAFVDAHPVFVKKRVDLSKGDGVELIKIDEIKAPLKEYFDQLKASNVFQLEERIAQSARMCALNESSVNTIRCNAFVTRSGVRVPFTFLKVGRQGSFVDNGGKGGILVGIDEKTGVLNTRGMDEYGNVFDCHPESHTPFIGFQLPDWEGVLRLCAEITPMVKGIQAIGWDLAHTDEGWVIVEGNLFSQFVGPQITREQGLKQEWLSVMQDMKLLA